jgi:pyruvate/2-oxoglutarate dehydrogenase complex dihydrolipoamide dehydrogenase (E3) component
MDWSTLFAGRNRYVAAINSYWDGYVDQQGITRIDGQARFVDAKTILVKGEQYSADHIVIATGGRPIVPRMPGAELGITSDGFFALETQPKRVAIIGGGYIGVELAGMLRTFGTEVTIVALEDRVLALFDPLISETLAENMGSHGIEMHLEFEVVALEQDNEGLALVARDGSRLQTDAPPHSDGAAVLAAVRPERLHLDPTAGPNRIDGVVEASAYHGLDLQLRLTTALSDTPVVVRLTADAATARPLSEGDPVTLYWAAENTRVFPA